MVWVATQGGTPITPYPAPMRWLRDAAYASFAAASSPVWAWRMHRSGKLRTDWRARFGHGERWARSGRPRLLIHAVSVGEVNAVRPLVARLESDRAAPEIAISATTDTGTARAREVFGARHAVVRYPFDASWMVARFLDRVQPDLVALTELELWPNFVAECARRGIPVVVINGRLSARSCRRYRAIRPLVAGTFASVRAALVQNRDYAERFAALGTDPARIFVTGTMKWDAAVIADEVPGADSMAAELGVDPRAPLVVAGSTAPEEHALLVEATPAGAQLLCAPRKPEWFEGAAAALPGCARRSRGERGSATGRFLLDTIGELRKAYGLADVVVIGRTFGSLYGSDMMEPAGLGRAIVCGPRVADFQETADALRAADALIQTDAAGLAGALAELLASPERRRELGRRAQEVVRAQQGATERTAEALLGILQEARRARA
jgi:3-deoxy-D-manno-octulosonic-acid transferase